MPYWFKASFFRQIFGIIIIILGEVRLSPREVGLVPMSHQSDSSLLDIYNKRTHCLKIFDNTKGNMIKTVQGRQVVVLMVAVQNGSYCQQPNDSIVIFYQILSL